MRSSAFAPRRRRRRRHQRGAARLPRPAATGARSRRSQGAPLGRPRAGTKAKRVQELELAIADAEKAVQAQRERAKAGAGTDANWETLHELARQEQALTRRLQQLTAEWLELCEQLEARGGAG